MLELPRWGLGMAPIGKSADALQAVDAVGAAWRDGIRYFDTAPKYGAGRSERRAGVVLSQKPRDEFVISTKVGTQATFQDFSGAAVDMSLSASLRRLALEYVDLVAIHDPDLELRRAIDECYPAVASLRDQGVVRAIGVGMNNPTLASRFVREADLDYVLIAGRYSLLDQSALDELLPLCAERDVAVIVGGVFNSGILASPTPHATFEYREAPASLLQRALDLERVCRRHEVSLAQAAMHFAFGHPAVSSVIVGAETADQVHENTRLAAEPPPAALWEELRSEGLIPAWVPVP